MYARDYRAQARAALKGKWIITTLMVLLASLLGAGSVSGGGVSFGNVDATLTQKMEYMRPEQAALILGITVVIMLGVFAYSLFLGSFVRVGLVNMMDKLLGGENPKVGMLFPSTIYWRAVKLNLLRSLFTFLWTLLFIIPGIIAAYRYVMADYLILHHPEMSATEALQESSRRMQGRKWRLFCLELSFIGWQMLILSPLWLTAILAGAGFVALGESFALVALALFMLLISLLLMIVAGLFLQSYMNAAVVAFYRDTDRFQQWRSEADAGTVYAQSVYSGPGNEATAEAPAADDVQAGEDFDPAGQPRREIVVPTVDESIARDLFVQHGCSRVRLRQAGMLDQYLGMNVDAAAEARWVRDHGQALMLRFSRDASVLDELLLLAGEYAMDDLLGRILERIDRHIRQQTLPDAEILNMAGRVLALLVSGAFSGNDGFVVRKKTQICDMTDRLEHRLEENAAEGDWREVLALMRNMMG